MACQLVLHGAPPTHLLVAALERGQEPPAVVYHSACPGYHGVQEAQGAQGLAAPEEGQVPLDLAESWWAGVQERPARVAEARAA